MTSDFDLTTRADQFQQIRNILAAIAREAGNRGIEELVDLAAKADALLAGMLEPEAVSK